ncbi:MAG: hypothetical protein WCG77_11765 [Actinomycetes bacterium]
MELVLLGFVVLSWWLWTRLRRVMESSSHVLVRPVTPGLLICHQGPWGYWLSADRLMRAPIHGGVADWSRALEVDPFEIDVPPAELMEIIDALEQAQARHGS